MTVRTQTAPPGSPGPPAEKPVADTHGAGPAEEAVEVSIGPGGRSGQEPDAGAPDHGARSGTQFSHAADDERRPRGEGLAAPENRAELSKPLGRQPSGERGESDAAVSEQAAAGLPGGDTATPGESEEPEERSAPADAVDEGTHHPTPGEQQAALLADGLRLAEALVFASASPVTARTLSQLLPTELDADAVITALRERYAGRGVELVEAGGGLQFRTAIDLAPRLRKVIEAPRRLPRVAMETLAIIAYHQPVTRPEIEEIRGASLSQQTLDSLLEANLVMPKGRRESPGRPTLWGTTPQFLTQFGLKDIRDLPRRDDLLVEPPQPAARSSQEREEGTPPEASVDAGSGDGSVYQPAAENPGAEAVGDGRGDRTSASEATADRTVSLRSESSTPEGQPSLESDVEGSEPPRGPPVNSGRSSPG